MARRAFAEEVTARAEELVVVNRRDHWYSLLSAGVKN
jgi:hypothetical protein